MVDRTFASPPDGAGICGARGIIGGGGSRGPGPPGPRGAMKRNFWARSLPFSICLT